VDELIARCASQNGVSADVLHALLALEVEFPDFTAWGSKSEFSRRVARLLDQAAHAAAAAG